MSLCLSAEPPDFEDEAFCRPQGRPPRAVRGRKEGVRWYVDRIRNRAMFGSRDGVRYLRE